MPPIRTFIVDDSVLTREIVIEVLASDPEIEIVGTASSGEEALPLIERLRPQLVTLDLALPGMNGLVTLAEIHKLRPALPVIVFSAFAEPPMRVRPNSRDRGITEFIAKPNQRGSRQIVREEFRRQLIPRIKSLCAASRLPADSSPKGSPVSHKFTSRPIDIVAIGASTGGPEALAALLTRLPEDFPVPIVIVQHMPVNFTRLLAERLALLTSLPVMEGKPGQRIDPGEVWIAPGDYHMTVVRQDGSAVLAMNHDPTEQGCRPSVNVLFRSLAKTYGPRVLAIVLTGMGADGTSGAKAVQDAGGEIIVQDRATSVIWGMPGRIVAAGLAPCICPIDRMAYEIIRRVQARKSAPSAFAAAT
ncbi:MAG: chemotaxis-specific protein-glutamate methyltransferase CheB [Acidobacteria bacterium]|nr:chemotaxis-specific protein-glutamate methyltransferase CheB [Acidobacteriota bacterium]